MADVLDRFCKFPAANTVGLLHSTVQSLTLPQVLGWAGLAKVDGQAYVWVGTPGVPNVNVSKATQKSLQVSLGLSLRLRTILICRTVHLHPECFRDDCWSRRYDDYFP